MSGLLLWNEYVKAVGYAFKNNIFVERHFYKLEILILLCAYDFKEACFN